MIQRGFLKLVRTRNGIRRLLVGHDKIPGENVAPPPSCDQVGPSFAPNHLLPWKGLIPSLMPSPCTLMRDSVGKEKCYSGYTLRWGMMVTDHLLRTRFSLTTLDIFKVLNKERQWAVMKQWRTPRTRTRLQQTKWMRSVMVQQLSRNPMTEHFIFTHFGFVCVLNYLGYSLSNFLYVF